MKLKLLFFSCFFYFVVNAQIDVSPFQFEIDRAYQAFSGKKYNTAATLYRKIYTKEKDPERKQKILFMIAESYRLSNNLNQAMRWYHDLVNSKYPDPKVLFSYAQLLKNFEKYDEAAKQFFDYTFEIPEDEKGKIAQQSCATALEWKSNPLKFIINNVKEINTEFSDYSPFIVNSSNADSKGKLIWTSCRRETQGTEIYEWTGQKYSDLFESDLKLNNTFGKISNIKGGINTNYNDGVAWMDSLGTTFYFTQCNNAERTGPKCKILVSYKQNNIWSAAQALSFNSDSFSCGHPALTSDGKKIFFASDMPGGFGEKDIYFSNYDEVKATWGTPVNLGANVNTDEDDMFPFVDENNVIYYSSANNFGMGGLDIYKTKDSSNTFKKSENLRYPINSGADDFGISFLPTWQRKENSSIGYFSSNRIDGKGDDDIYSISIKPFVFELKGLAINRENNLPLTSAIVTLTDNFGKKYINVKTNDKGEFATEIELNIVANLLASKEKYFSSTPINISTLDLKQDSILEVVLYLDPLPAREVDFTLNGILYDLDKFDLRTESKNVLDSVSILLKSNPTLVIEIGSHTDSRAPSEYNFTLSKKRAQVCVDYLLLKGIAKDRLVAIGYGETKLRNDCSDGLDCQEEEHQKNRRTTFRVLRTDYKIK